jgi:hypothetical protein
MDSRDDMDRRGRYDDADSRQRGHGYEDEEPKSQKITQKQALTLVGLIVVVSLLVSMAWGDYSMVSKKDFETNITNIIGDMGKIQASVPKDVSGTVNSLNTQVGSISDKINTITQDVASMKSSLSAYAKADALAQTNNSLTNIQNTLNSLQSQVNNIKQADTSGISASIETLKTQVASLDARIKVLESGGGGTSSSDVIQVSVKTLGNNALSPIDTKKADGTAGSDGTYDGLQGSMRVTLTNTSLVDVDDAIIDLEFNVAPSIPTAFTPSVSGGGVPWHREYSDYQFMEFYNGAWGLSVPAGQTVTLTLALTIQGTNSSAWNISGGYYYQLQASAS